MTFGKVRNRLVAYLAIGLVGSVASASAAPGFGGIGGLGKKTLDLKTRQPAPVRLANTSIAVTGGTVANPQYKQIEDNLLIALGTELVSNEKSLVEKQAKDASWLLVLTVTGFSVSEPKQYSQSSGNTAVQYIRWSGTLNAAYKVLDHSGRVHDAANIPSNYNQDFPVSAVGKTGRSWSIPGIHPKAPAGEKVPSSTEDVKQDLIQDVVQQIASKLGNTTKSIEVQIATGDRHLDRAAEFLQQKLWTRALDELEKTPAFAKPDQEAYRQYDLGLAYEAISYTSTTPNDQKDNIFKAAEYYDKALEMNEKEKYFVATVARTRDALARYKDLDRMAKQDQKVSPSSSAGVAVQDAADGSMKPQPTVEAPTPATSSPAISSGGRTIDLSHVINMQKRGVPQDQIVEIIKASQVQFDPLDADTAIAIADAKLPIAIQNALRAKVGAPLLKSPGSIQKTAVAKPK